MRDLVSDDTAEHENVGGDTGAAKGDAFLQKRHAKRIASRGEQLLRRAHESVSIRIRLDRRHDARGTDLRAHRGHVGAQGVEIDVDHRGSQDEGFVEKNGFKHGG